MREVFDKRDVADILARDDIAHHDGVVHTLEIIADLAFLLDVVKTEAGKTADAKVMEQRVVGIFEAVELKELAVAEAINGDFYVAAAEARAQFGGENVGVAAGSYYLATVFGVEAAQRVFVAFDVLHFVDEQVVFAAGFEFRRHIIVKFGGSGEVSESEQLLVDIHHRGIRAVFAEPAVQLAQHETLADAALPNEDNHHTTVKVRDDAREVRFSDNNLHKA